MSNMAGEDKGRSDDKCGADNAKNMGHALVMGLVEHASRVLHTEMAGFFEEHVEAFMDFDDAARELGQGEKHAQFAVFRDYQVELEHHFDGFARKRGFESVHACFDAIRVRNPAFLS